MPKVYMDDYSGRHVSQRIRERIADPADQAQTVAMIKKLKPTARVGTSL